MTFLPPITTAEQRHLDEARKQAHAAQGQTEKLLAWSRVLERVVHLITKDPSHKVITSNGSSRAPAWTDGQDIWLSRRVFKADHPFGNFDNDIEAVLTVKGLVYHELGHILLSDRAGGPLRSSLADPTQTDGANGWRLHKVWNVLEDGRQESLFVNRFPRAAAYFSVPVLKWIIEPLRQAQPREAAAGALLIIGRTYLPREVRGAAYDRLVEVVGDADAAALAGWVTTYRRTTASEWRVRFNAVLEVDRILSAHSQEPTGGDDHEGQTEGEPEEDGEDVYGDPCPDGDPAEGEADEGDDGDGGEADGTDGSSEGDEGDEEAEGDGSGDADDAEADPEAEDGNDGSGGDAGDDDANDADGDAEGDGASGDTEDAEGDSTGNGGYPRGLDLTDEARRALRAIETSPEVLEDIEQTLDAIDAETQSSAGTGSTGLDVTVRNLEPSADSRLVRHRVAEAFEALRADKAPVTDRRLRAGRVNSRRLLDPTRQVHEIDFFDRRNNDGEGFDVELVLLLDLSGSMTHRIDAAAEALWATVVAADGEGISTTVVHFASDDQWGVLKTPQDRWEEGTVLRPTPGGGTDPVQALAWTVDTLKESTAHYRAIITITDGEWASNEVLYRSLLGEASQDGIRSLTIGIAGADVERTVSIFDSVSRTSIECPNNGHGAEQAVNVQTLLDLPVTIQQFVDHIVAAD